MHEVIEEANSSYHRGRFYIIRVMKMGRLITWNMKHKCSTPVTRQQYPCEQIKEGTGQLEDFFAQAVLVEHDKIPWSYTADTRAQWDH